MDWMPNCSPLWFLPCLFFAKCLFHLIMRYTSGKMQIMWIYVCCGISYLWYRLDLLRLPWNMATVPMAVFFLWAGYEIRKHDIVSRISSDPRRMLLFLPVLLLSPILIRNGRLVGMNENTYGNLGLFLVGALGYSMLVCAVARVVAANYLLTDFFGRNTIIVIGFNYFCRYASTELYYLVPVIKRFHIHWLTSFLLTTAMLAGIIMFWMTIQNGIQKQKELKK